tara:strand:+ start:88 stop:402 length:315 start_codon:yes stop_codon:yes gene_type:complete
MIIIRPLVAHTGLKRQNIIAKERRVDIYILRRNNMFEVKIVLEIPVENKTVTLADVRTMVEEQVEKMVSEFDEKLDKQVFGETKLNISFNEVSDLSQEEFDFED